MSKTMILTVTLKEGQYFKDVTGVTDEDLTVLINDMLKNDEMKISKALAVELEKRENGGNVLFTLALNHLELCFADMAKKREMEFFKTNSTGIGKLLKDIFGGDDNGQS